MTRPLLRPEELPNLAHEANLAPSVHNTQPTRWRLEPDGGLLLLEDMSRRLNAADPQGRDALVSHGAALEGMTLALAARGAAVRVSPAEDEARGGLRPVARLHMEAAGESDGLRNAVAARSTWRGVFLPGDRDANAAIETLAERCPDLLLVNDSNAVAMLAALNDDASLRFFRQDAYRKELLAWMRLSRRHPNWSRDGLNADALHMAAWEAAGAGLVLGRGFSPLDALGLARFLMGEATKVRSATAVALFHRPEEESPLEIGRRFYRVWLEMTARGLSAAPMAVLADDAEAAKTIRETFAIPSGRRLTTAFRIGRAPERKPGSKPRLPAVELVV